MAETMAVLKVRDLKTYYFTLSGVTKAVDGVTLELHKKESLGLAGESGCGKTSLALSLLRLLPAEGRIVSGRIFLDGEDVTHVNEPEMEKIRWKKISIIPQQSMNALNPMFKVGDQIVEAILTHEKTSKNEAQERAKNLLQSVGIDSSRASNYPHEFSGGMKQRVMIAMALACHPIITIADEPLTALDVMVQAQVLNLMKKMQEELDLSVIHITHNLAVLMEVCDRIAVMYAGKIVECARTASLYENAVHPYSRALMKCFPSIGGRKSLASGIPGMPPSLLNPPSGCRFRTRCPYAREVCRDKEPELMEVESGHHVACHLKEHFLNQATL